MDIDLARRAIRNQKTYYRERDKAGEWIDYDKVIKGELHLVPQGEPYELLKNDYAEMTKAGYIFSGHISFDQLMANIRELDNHVNMMMSKEISSDNLEPGF